jgi:hypothetical protein
VARALVRSRLEDHGIRPEDVLPEAGPVLVHTTVPEDTYVNAMTDAGLRAFDLPRPTLSTAEAGSFLTASASRSGGSRESGAAKESRCNRSGRSADL